MEKTSFWGFWKYWFENFKLANDVFGFVVFILLAISVVIFCVGQWGSYPDVIIQFYRQKQLQDLGAIAAGLILTGYGLVWLPFKQHVKESNEFLAEKKALENSLVDLKKSHTEKLQSLQNEINQLKEHMAQNEKIVVTASFAIENDNGVKPVLTIKVVNTGHRKVVIERLAVSLESTPDDTHELLILKPDKFQVINPDGDLHVWQQVINFNAAFTVIKRDSQEFGCGYVILTTGKQIPFEFSLNTWNGFNRR